jgi:hypothetical protein
LELTAWVLTPPGPSNLPVGSTAGFQPTRVPSSVANRKTAEAVMGLPFLSNPLTVNPPVGPPSMLKTVPVGAPEAPRGSTGVGMLTTRGLIEAGLLAPGMLP